MADFSLSLGASQANPTLSRRSILRSAGMGSVGIVAVAATMPVAAMGLPTIDRPDGGHWWRLHRRLLRLRAATNSFRREVEDPANASWSAACESIPHQTVTYSLDPATSRTFSTANSNDLASARRFIRGLVRVDKDSGLQDYHRACTELLQAQQGREAETLRLADLYRVDETSKRGERMHDIIYKITWKLLLMPAPDGKAALWKFDYLFGGDDGQETPAWNLNDEDVTLAIADVRRCLVGEA